MLSLKLSKFLLSAVAQHQSSTAEEARHHISVWQGTDLDGNT